jgi:dTDP-glucose pyrophosphorylase
VIALLLRELAGVSLGRATIVIGHLGEQIVRLVGDGSCFGIAVSYAEQPRALGSADAVRRALEAGAEPPLLVTAADTAYRPGDLAAVAARFRASGAAGGLGVRPVPREEIAERASVRVQDGLVVEVIEKPPPDPVEAGQVPPAVPATALAAAPLWLMAQQIIPFLEAVQGPPYQLAHAFQAAIEAGEAVAALELGPTRDLTRPADLVTHNFPYL